MSHSKKTTLIACSATMNDPEEQFRYLCPASCEENMRIITKDCAPSPPKHFFIWNPPLLNLDGSSVGSVTVPPASEPSLKKKTYRPRAGEKKNHFEKFRRRHSAD